MTTPDHTRLWARVRGPMPGGPRRPRTDDVRDRAAAPALPDEDELFRDPFVSGETSLR